MTRREIFLLSALLVVTAPTVLIAQGPCPTTPRLDCRRSHLSKLLVKKTASGEHRIAWRWTRGAPTSAADLANPLAATEYAVCAYTGPDQNPAFAAALAPGPAHWTVITGERHLYRNDGVVKRLAFRPAAHDASRLTLRALGPLSPASGMVLPVTIQLINPDSGVCWESIFRTAEEQAPGRLRALHRAVPKPNVILIQTDDQRWDTIPYMPTVLEEIAAKGVTFANTFAPNPVCGPSRASLLTGNYSHTHGVLTNGPFPSGGALKFVGPDEETIAVWMQSAGYRTAHFGKYINGTFLYCDDATCTVPPGWDEWHAFPTDDYFNYMLSETGPLASYGGAPEDYSTDVLRDKALAFLDAHPDEPVFVHFAPFAPHVSVQSSFLPVPAPRHEGARGDVPPWRPESYLEPEASDKPLAIQQQPSVLSPLETLYYDVSRILALESLLAVDEAVAAILAKIEAQGRTEDTVVIFTSDNGDADGEHRLFGKLCPYEECIRTPLIVRYPRLLGDTAQLRDELAMIIDLAPTIAEWGQVSPGAVPAIDGRSLARVAEGAPTTWRDTVLLEQWQARRYAGVRTAEWKYVLHGTDERELYDLINDPHELTNVVGVLPAIADELEARIVELGGSLP